MGSPPGFGSVWGGVGAPRGCCDPLASVMSWAGLSWAGAMGDVAEATPALRGPQSTPGGSVTPGAAQSQPFPRLIAEPGGSHGCRFHPGTVPGTAPSLPSWSSCRSPPFPLHLLEDPLNPQMCHHLWRGLHGPGHPSALPWEPGKESGSWNGGPTTRKGVREPGGPIPAASCPLAAPEIAGLTSSPKAPRGGQRGGRGVSQKYPGY